jgi:acyl phosphate:glycerol-3-phosphate acyltransferase
VTPLAAAGLAYLIGAIPVGYLVARAFGIGDIRDHGSGNIGATNVLRTAGKLPAVLTLVGDVVKGAAAVALGAAWSGEGRVAAACALAALVGNCWSIFLGFRGGKGGATGLGAFLALVPWALLPAALVWLAVTTTFRYVSLATVTSAACVPLGALALGYPRPSVVACVLGAAIVVARHRDNLARLTAGTERRLGQRAG